MVIGWTKRGSVCLSDVKSEISKVTRTLLLVFPSSAKIAFQRRLSIVATVKDWTMGKSLICLLLTVVSLLLAPVSSSLDGPFIVAHKKATLTRLKSGIERVSISIDIYNQGSATAYDVSLNDDGWSRDIFDIVSGNTSMSWERLDTGALLSHSFELEAKVKTLFYGTPAVITFRVPTKAALQEAYSTPILPLDLLADRPPEKKFELAKRLLAKYGSLISVISIVVLFIYLVATPSKSSVAKASKKKR